MRTIEAAAIGVMAVGGVVLAGGWIGLVSAAIGGLGVSAWYLAAHRRMR